MTSSANLLRCNTEIEKEDGGLENECDHIEHNLSDNNEEDIDISSVDSEHKGIPKELK